MAATEHTEWERETFYTFNTSLLQPYTGVRTPQPSGFCMNVYVCNGSAEWMHSNSGILRDAVNTLWGKIGKKMQDEGKTTYWKKAGKFWILKSWWGKKSHFLCKFEENYFKCAGGGACNKKCVLWRRLGALLCLGSLLQLLCRGIRAIGDPESPRTSALVREVRSDCFLGFALTHLSILCCWHLQTLPGSF